MKIMSNYLKIYWPTFFRYNFFTLSICNTFSAQQKAKYMGGFVQFGLNVFMSTLVNFTYVWILVS